ncbi:MAG: phage late control D family protein [Acidimicrobiia bacterium]
MSEFHSGRSFMTPAFEVHLNGASAGREVIADVLDVSFNDDPNSIDSFEFSLNDWDPVAVAPKYSSPWDEEGRPRTLPDGGPPVPSFEPGTPVSLYLGYRDEGDLPLIMDAEVVSISTSFPATGQPIAKVRALDAFQRELQRIWVEGNYSGTPKGIVDTLCQEHDIAVRWAPLEDEGEEEERVAIDGPLYDTILARVKDYGLAMMTSREGVDVELLLARPGSDNAQPVAEFVWGRTLVDFSPVLSAAAQVSEVVARVADPDGEGADRAVEVVKTWSDIGLSPAAIGPTRATDIDAAVRGMREVIKPDGMTAEAAALARLRELAAELITGSGTSIGLPELRSGRTVQLTGLGARFSGLWRITKTTHTLGASGYTTKFSARKEVLE